MSQPITVLNRFSTRTQRTPEDPPFIPELHVKNWADPGAKPTGYDMNDVPQTEYTFFVGYDYVAKEPLFVKKSIPTDFARVTNMLPEGPTTNVAKKPELPCPVRGLEDDEVILPYSLGVFLVYKRSEIPTPETASGFTGEDRAMLKRIATAIGA